MKQREHQFGLSVGDELRGKSFENLGRDQVKDVTSKVRVRSVN
jgi:hypothetical protein